jgi:hypothetical protein
MTDRSMYAVFLHPQAVEALGPAIRPYLLESQAGPHLQCVEVDSGGALFEMTLVGRDNEGRTIEVELMIPTGMVRLVISVRQDGEFGFGARRETPTEPAEKGGGDTAAGSAPSAVAPGAAST